MNDYNSYIKERLDQLKFYVPFHYIPDPEIQTFLPKLVDDSLQKFGSSNSEQVIQITIAGEEHVFFVQYLPWDSNFFGRSVFKVYVVLFSHHDIKALTQAIIQFLQAFSSKKDLYLFMEIPAEDILLAQAFTKAGFALIETRLTYYRTTIDSPKQQFQTRKATELDIPSIRETASTCRNLFDRFHAEPTFSQEQADRFLSKYAEEAVRGYCNAVLVPDEPNIPCKAFLALNNHLKIEENSPVNISKIVLTAVAPDCRGWHYKLVSEAIAEAKNKGSQYITMTTQATNRAVIRNSEKLGFLLGITSHILSYSLI